MKIELKNIIYYPQLSEETSAFTGEIFVDGVRVGVVRSDGKGGMPNSLPYVRGLDLESGTAAVHTFRMAEQYLRSLPHYETDLGYGEIVREPCNMDSFAEREFQKWLAKRDADNTMMSFV